MTAEEIPAVRVVEPVEVREPIHVIVERMRAFLALLAMVITAVSALSAWVVTKATGDISSQLQHVELRAVVDSVRFERAMEVVELAVIALVEDEKSPERKAALHELRHRRHISPR